MSYDGYTKKSQVTKYLGPLNVFLQYCGAERKGLMPLMPKPNISHDPDPDPVPSTVYSYNLPLWNCLFRSVPSYHFPIIFPIRILYALGLLLSTILATFPSHNLQDVIVLIVLGGCIN
jgi:hypothetical protein